MMATTTTARSGRPGAYGRVFWFAYISNALTMTAMGLLFRYADFVTHLGGSEGQLGMIVGIGMIGSLAMRVGQGVGIDRYGSRMVWLSSLVLFVLSQLAHLLIHNAAGPAIIAVRILMQTSLAGIFGASITYISRRVPPARMAEIIGTLGTSGFIGILLGPQLGDLIFGEAEIGRSSLNLMFCCAAGLGLLATAFAWGATQGALAPLRRRQPPTLGLLRRYHPGIILLVAIAVGAGISVPNTFLRPFAAERDIHRIGLFFATYAIMAFAVRISTRRLFERYGTRPWVLCGLASMSMSVLLYLTVQETWQLVIPGIAAGTAHALLFPAVVAGGSTAFPERYRGLGTTLMLAMFDVGNLFGAPLIGGALLLSRHAGWPAYPTTFAAFATVLLSVAVLFATRSHRRAPAVMTPARRETIGGPHEEPECLEISS